MFAYPKQAEVQSRRAEDENLRTRQALEAGQRTLRVRRSARFFGNTNSPRRRSISPPGTGSPRFRSSRSRSRRRNSTRRCFRRLIEAIPFPLLFQLTHGDHIRFAASYKRPSDADSSKWVIEASFQTEPQPLDAERPPLPVALDLAGLYEQIVRRHIPLPPRSGRESRGARRPLPGD